MDRATATMTINQAKKSKVTRRRYLMILGVSGTANCFLLRAQREVTEMKDPSRLTPPESLSTEATDVPLDFEGAGVELETLSIAFQMGLSLHFSTLSDLWLL